MNSRTVEGARLRRHVLRGAVIVFITAGARGAAAWNAWSCRVRPVKRGEA